MSISAMKQALEALEKLWDIIDDIDTYGDMAKSDDKLYRSLVERRQRQRFEQTGISTDGYELNGGAITALRQAIAEAEKQEQKTPLKVLGLTVFTENRLRNGRVYDVETLQAMNNRDILAIPDMGKKALKEVLEALDAYAIDISEEPVDETAKREREWVGLEEEEILKCFDSVALGQVEGDCVIDKHVNIFNAIRAIEAKLKEKNT